MPGKTFASKMSEWRYLIEHMRPLLTDVPHLAGDHATLESLFTQAQALDTQAQQLRGTSKDVYQRRGEVEDRGNEIRARLSGALIHHFGPKSEKLIGFGVAPRPRQIHRTPKAAKELAALKAQMEKAQQEKAPPGEGKPGTDSVPPPEPSS
jgi:uncharacterized membrane protein YccC